MLSRRVSWLGAAIALVAAAPAHAATMGITGTTIVYQAAPGEVNGLAVSLHPNTVSIFQTTGGVLTAGPGCTVAPPLEVVDCPAEGITDVIVKLADGDDQARTPATSATPSYEYQVQGGSGRDQIFGTTRSDKLSGETGPDIVNGNGGRDDLSGGDGNDQIVGQGRVEGGPGNDTMVLDAGFGRADVGSRVFGGGGNDRINGRNKVRDVINCGAGKRDRTAVDKGRDRISSNC